MTLTRRTLITSSVAAAAAAVAFTGLPGAAAAQDNFYAGKTVTIVVGAPPTGSYGSYTVLLANHLGKHIPGNPNVVTNFQGGADGGLGTAQYMEKAAPKDGTYIGITQQTIPVTQFLQPDVGNFDVTTWQWIGGIAPIRNMLSLWHTSPAQTIEEAKETEVRVAATSSSSPMYIVPHMMNEFLGTKFDIILGYDGVGGSNLAMEQGEVHGRGASWASVVIRTPHYIEDNLLHPIVVDGATRDPAIPDTPTLIELAPDKETRQVFQLLAASATFGRSYFFPAGVPEDRVEIMRKAFSDTMTDPAFLAEAEAQHISIEPVTAEELTMAVEELEEIPPHVVKRAAEAMQAE